MGQERLVYETWCKHGKVEGHWAPLITSHLATAEWCMGGKRIILSPDSVVMVIDGDREIEVEVADIIAEVRR